MNDKYIKSISINVILPYMLIVFQTAVFEFANGFGIYTNLFFETIIVYSVYIILLFFLRSTKNVMFILNIVSDIILIAFQIKIATIGEPIYFSDLKLIKNIIPIIGLVDFKNVFKNIDFIKLIISMIILYIPMYYCSFKYNIKIQKKSKKIVILFFLSIITLFLIFVPNSKLDKLKLKVIYNVNTRELTNVKKLYVSNNSYYTTYGIIGGFYGTYLENIIFEPDGYNDNELENQLKNLDINKEINLGTPNIIVIFSESFWDISKIDEIKFNKDITYNFNNLKNEGLLLNLISPSFGERSLNVDFELLTGGSMKYFSGGYIPLTQLYNDSKAYNYPSYIKELKNNGYISKIIFGKDYYKSRKALSKVGFDNYEELIANDENKKGKFISDEYMTNYVINEMEKKDKNQKIFLMAETIQNHQKYNIDKYSNYDIEIVDSNLKKEQNDILLSYAQGVYDADNELKNIYEYIKSIDEDTILIFMGDHLPYLSTKSGKNVFKNIEYFNTEDKLLNLYRKYNTQALVLANYDIGELKGKEKNLSCNLILDYILNNMDINLSDYYQWLYTTIDTLPASNRYISIDNENELLYTNELSGKIKETYNNEEKMQYKFWNYNIEKNNK